MWDLDLVASGIGVHRPGVVTDDRPGIWISYVPVEEVAGDLTRLTRLGGHRQVALPHYEFEAVKIGAGPPPVRIPEGWLLIHHGVSGELLPGVVHQPHVHYAAGAMILSADDPSRLLARTSEPLLNAAVDAERDGIVPNVVFPTAIEEIEVDASSSTAWPTRASGWPLSIESRPRQDSLEGCPDGWTCSTIVHRTAASVRPMALGAHGLRVHVLGPARWTRGWGRTVG